MLKHFYRFFLGFFLILVLFYGYCFAENNDGFGSASKIESQHFAIFYSPQLDPEELARELDIHPLDKIISGGSYSSDLGGMVDTLFSQVCDILDMRLYSFRGNIKICRDDAQVSEIYRNLFDKPLNNHSFYVYDTNTVYISNDHFKKEILGHEIGHAVISHYFVVLPSVKIQEVLAVFVEYQLRKLYK